MKHKSYSPQQWRNLRVVICRRSKRLIFKPIQRDGSLAIFKYQEYVRQRIFQKNYMIGCCWIAWRWWWWRRRPTMISQHGFIYLFMIFSYRALLLCRYFVMFAPIVLDSSSMRTDKNHTNGFLATQIMLFERTRSFSLPDYYHLRLLFIFMCLLKCVIHE